MDGNRKRRAKTSRSKPVTLGPAAMRAIQKNQAVVSEFMEELRDGTLDVTKYFYGRVVHVYGNRFDVLLADGREVRAGLSGILTGHGGFFRNPEATTAVRLGSDVVVEDLKFGYGAKGRAFEIIGILGRADAAEARARFGLHSGHANRGSSDNSLFNYANAANSMLGMVVGMGTIAAPLPRASKHQQATGAMFDDANATANGDDLVAPFNRADSDNVDIHAEMKADMAAAAREKAAAAREKKVAAFHKRKTAKKEKKGSTAK